MSTFRPDPSRAFLGVGWAFPPGLASDGSFQEAAYEDDVRQAIWIILGTNPGERVMRPDFGAGLRRFVFEPINSSTLSRIETAIKDALVDWEPRIDVQQVKAEARAPAGNAVLVHVNYLVRATNSLHNLVYPFYLEEGTPQ